MYLFGPPKTLHLNTTNFWDLPERQRPESTLIRSHLDYPTQLRSFNRNSLHQTTSRLSMNTLSFRKICFSILFSFLCTAPALADDATRRAMQEQLNAEVMSRPFNAGDVQKAEQYAADALKRNIKPVSTPPPYWQKGWTCANLTGYRYYNYSHYRNCVYYNRYYGSYW